MADTPRVSVPVEPTEEMIEAAESAGMSMAGSDMSSPDMTRYVWSAMLSAAPAPEGGAMEATGAKAVIRNGQIVISIDVDALPLILSGSIALNAVAGTFKVTDAATFAKEVCYALNAEKEDGTTRVHMMFDSAFDHAIDQGAEGVEEISEDEFESEAARLQAEAKAALATREEAPEEAGEAQKLIDDLRYVYSQMTPSAIERMDSDGAATIIERAIEHLRAQPPAREDAQPDAGARLARAMWGVDLVPAANPAPDALRVAVEALENISHIRTEMVGVPVDSEAANAWGLALDAAADYARQALAALQAEQGAK